ncbi:MAG: PorP/SprF family type IX secretion system membrane protein [Flavisolibacter sp.]
MKRTLPLLILMFAVQLCWAQQMPHYTQYVLNNYILNPALSGIENYTDVKMSARKQWVGLDGAPQTFYFSIHGALGKEDYKTTATSFNVPGENPRGKAYWENYAASDPHHGIGFYMVNDRTGLFNRFQADVSYAYHIGLSPRTNMAMGFSGGFSKLSYDRAKATPVDPNDPALGNAGGLYKLMPDLNAGIWIYSADYFIGIAAQQLLPQKVSFTGNSEGFQEVTHLFATAGYRLMVDDDVNLLPSVMMKYVPSSSVAPQFDINAKVQYRDLFWIGGSCRIKEGYAAMVGLNVANTFNICYSYDISTTQLNTVSRGTHEMIVGFLIGNRYKDTCPRNIW